MGISFRSFWCLVLLTLAAGQVVRADEAEDVCKRLTKLSGILLEGWPKGAAYESLEIKPVKAGAAGKYVISMQLKDADDGRLNRCLLVAGQAVGVMLAEKTKIESAGVRLNSPDKSYVAELPLEQCKKLGEALLADPRDESEVKNRILFFAGAARGKLFEVKPKDKP